MNTKSSSPRTSPGLAIAFTAMLAAAAVIYTGYHLSIAVQSDDTNHLETPLGLAVARELQEGPTTLYGPFNGARPLVLIHAPLYYRLAALAAWPIVALGCDINDAAFAAGRWLSLLAWVVTLFIVWQLALLDGASRWAGLWSALLIAASPVFGSFPVTVRPDTVGIALQTLGVWLVLRALCGSSSQGLSIIVAYAAFGLAFCVKQHLVASAAVSSGLLTVAWFRGRLRLAPIVLAYTVGLAIIGVYYGLEELSTSGLMSRSVFFLPAEFRRLTHAGWDHVGLVLSEVAKRSAGLLALAFVCLTVGRRVAMRSRLDALLALYFAAELFLMVALCLGSTGAWVNYAMPPIIFASIMVSRGLARLTSAEAAPRSLRTAVPVLLAGLVLIVVDSRLVAISAAQRLEDASAVQALIADERIGTPAPQELYFAGVPQHNRRYGVPALAHDEWLYGLYEAVGEAEPRSEWLRSALITGPIRVVVVPSDRSILPGLTEPLADLGYSLVARHGGYFVWERRSARARAHRVARLGPSRHDSPAQD